MEDQLTHEKVKRAFRFKALILPVVVSCLAIAAILIWSDALRESLNQPQANTNEVSRKIPITRVVERYISPGENAVFDDLTIQFLVSPRAIEVGREVWFRWILKDAQGNLTAPDNNVHDALTHAYAVHDDGAGELIHIHPAMDEDIHILEFNQVVFTRPGVWHFQMQISKNGTIYNLLTDFSVVGEAETSPPRVSFDRKVLSGRSIVGLTLDPAVPKKNEPFTMRFEFENKEADYNPHVDQMIKNSNVLLLADRRNLMWNEHGDDSVAAVSEQAGFLVRRKKTSDRLLEYKTVVPEAGIWRVRLEIVGASDFHFKVAD